MLKLVLISLLLLQCGKEVASGYWWTSFFEGVPYKMPQYCGSPPAETLPCSRKVRNESRLNCIQGSCQIWGSDFECVTCVCKPGFSGTLCCHDDNYKEPYTELMRQQRSNSVYNIKFGRPQPVPEYAVADANLLSNLHSSMERRGSSVDSYNNNWRRDSSSTQYQIYQECCYCQNPQAMLRKCSNCRQAQYCSKECQKLDWYTHRSECKLKNPTYFDKSAKCKVEWLKILGLDELNSCIVDSFKLRCIDEVKITGKMLQRNEISPKFTRYLQAVRGVHILPDWYQKIDLLKLRNESLFDHNITAAAGKIASELDAVEAEISLNGYSANWGLKNLRNLHEVACGPIEIGQADVFINCI